MNKNFKKTMIAGLACLAFCGTLTAAPDRANPGRAPQKAPAHQQARQPERGHNGGRQARNPAPKHGAPVAHHTPAPAPHHHEPPPPPTPHHHGGHHEGAGWVAFGAAVVGGIVGGLVGACN